MPLAKFVGASLDGCSTAQVMGYSSGIGSGSIRQATGVRNSGPLAQIAVAIGSRCKRKDTKPGIASGAITSDERRTGISPK